MTNTENLTRAQANEEALWALGYRVRAFEHGINPTFYSFVMPGRDGHERPKGRKCRTETQVWATINFFEPMHAALWLRLFERNHPDPDNIIIRSHGVWIVELSNLQTQRKWRVENKVLADAIFIAWCAANGRDVVIKGD